MIQLNRKYCKGTVIGLCVMFLLCENDRVKKYNLY